MADQIYNGNGDGSYRSRRPCCDDRAQEAERSRAKENNRSPSSKRGSLQNRSRSHSQGVVNNESGAQTNQATSQLLRQNQNYNSMTGNSNLRVKTSQSPERQGNSRFQA